MFRQVIIPNSKRLLLAGFLLTSLPAWPQASSQRIVSTIDRGDYVVIPPETFQPDVVGIVLPAKATYKVIHDEIPLTFFWFSMCTDGTYTVTVTPEQIYFRTSHENPNRNYLYWVLAITQDQYKAIKRKVTSRPPAGFLYISEAYQRTELAYKSKAPLLTGYPEGWTDKQYATYCTSEVDKQLTAIFQLLNSPFAKPIFRRPKNTPRLISSTRAELLDWLPRQAPKK